MRLVNDDTWAVMTIWQEARNQGPDGMLAVAEVIRNRMMHKYSSDGTAAGTVLHPLQFSGWNSVDPNRIPSVGLDDQDPIVQACITAWNTAVHDATDSVNGALLYCRFDLKPIPDWIARCNQVARVQDHVFYLPQAVSV